MKKNMPLVMLCLGVAMSATASAGETVKMNRDTVEIVEALKNVPDQFSEFSKLATGGVSSITKVTEDSGHTSFVLKGAEGRWVLTGTTTLTISKDHNSGPVFEGSPRYFYSATVTSGPLER